MIFSKPLLSPEPERPGNRINDGHVGPDGSLYFGTMDDDELMVGNSPSWPWTCYLADCPDLDCVTRVCNVVRETEIDGARLWKYLRVEARVGRKLFFGNE